MNNSSKTMDNPEITTTELESNDHIIRHEENIAGGNVVDDLPHLKLPRKFKYVGVVG